MAETNRYAVPMESLDGVRVGAAEQVQEQTAPRQPEAATWTGGQLSRHGDGAGGDVDGDGD